jgi:signal transduction histidine kinase
MTAVTRADRLSRDALRMLPGIIEILSQSGRRQGVLASVVDLILDATGADACFLHRWDPESRRLQMAAASNPYSELVGEIELAEGEGVAGWVAKHRLPVVIARDKWSDPRYKYIPELGGDRYTSMVSLPATSGRGRLMGVLNLHTVDERDFNRDDLEFLTATASLVAAHLEAEELIETTLAKEAELEALVQSTLAAQETERRRLATEIHDGVTQLVVAALYRLRAAQSLLEGDHPAAAEIVTAADLLDEAEQESRRAIRRLRPPVLDDLGLVPALRELTQEISDGQRIEIRATSDLVVGEEVELVLYRVAQEALRNVAKHAQAQQVTVTLDSDPDGVRMAIIDDGVGFDVAGAFALKEGASYGMAGMRERVEMVGGTFRVASEPGQGSRIDVSVPK